MKHGYYQLQTTKGKFVYGCAFCYQYNENYIEVDLEKMRDHLSRYHAFKMVRIE